MFIAAAALTFAAAQVGAQSMEPREGWSVSPTTKSYADLVEATKDAITGEGFGVVTEAGPTEAAAQRGVEIPGNRVIGAFNNVYAVRILELSVPAMIEAPVRFYVTENEDGTAMLSYKLPSHVFAPYYDDAGEELETIAGELDAAFAAIAEVAVN
ncbi:DUF302 domain-containing protein [Amaricoccus macauensis]|uniref:DUF302 domain-containing protein n=1 Tax=Amaricoccus macauensis TaxID=57001 RepID=UPI003C7EB0C4